MAVCRARGGLCRDAWAGALPAAAEAPDPAYGGPTRTFLGADITQPGVVSLHFFSAAGGRVVYYERVGTRLKRLGARRGAPPGRATILRDAVLWKCSPLSRRFTATATLPGGRKLFGTYSVRTPSCARRFELRVPRRVERGKVGRIRVVDRWDFAPPARERPDVCLQAPGRERTCEPLRFRRAVAIATHRFRPDVDGRWRVRCAMTATSCAGPSRSVAARPPPQRPPCSPRATR